MRLPLGLVAASGCILLLTACAARSTRAPEPAPAPPPEPEPVAEATPVPEPEPTPEPDWARMAPSPSLAALAALGPLQGCSFSRRADQTIASCHEGRLVLEVTDGMADVDALTEETFAMFKSEGALAATWGTPRCTIGAGAGECSYVEVNLPEETYGVAAIGVRRDLGTPFSVRCSYRSRDRDALFVDPVCGALLELHAD